MANRLARGTLSSMDTSYMDDEDYVFPEDA